MRRMLTALLVLLLAGCTTAVDGQGIRAGGTAALPPRPFEIRLDGIAPCSLLTDAQRVELEIDDGGSRSGTSNSTFYGGEVEDCTIRAYEPQVVGVGLTSVRTAGVAVFFRPNVISTVSVIEVRGFPAVLAVPRDDTFCTVALDVADGQLVDVQYRSAGGVPPVPQPRLCEGAMAVADAVMDTLLAR